MSVHAFITDLIELRRSIKFIWTGN